MTRKSASQQAEFEQAIMRDGDLDREVASEWATSPLPAADREHSGAQNPFSQRSTCRLLIAQAEVEGLALLTTDSMVRNYRIPFSRHIGKISLANQPWSEQNSITTGVPRNRLRALVPASPAISCDRTTAPTVRPRGGAGFHLQRYTEQSAHTQP